MLLHYCKDGNIQKIRNIKLSKRNINAMDDTRTTSLMIASSCGYIEIVKILVENGANLNLQNTHGYSALIRACINNHPEVILYLIEKGTDVNLLDKQGDNALILARKLGNDEIIKNLLNKKADIHHLNKKNQNCLWFSSYYYNMSISFMFILMGIDPEIKDKYYNKNSYDVIGKNRDDINILNNHPEKQRISNNMKNEIKKLMLETRLEYLELKRCNDNWERRKNFMMILRGANIIPLKKDIVLNIKIDTKSKIPSVPRDYNYLLRQIFAYNTRKINKSSKNGCDLLELIISFI